MATDRHQAPSYPLRMPDELKARMQAEAEVNGRSLHAELLARLEGSLQATTLTKEHVASLRKLLESTESLLMDLSRAYIDLYELSQTDNERLRYIYISCRARTSNDPDEIASLGASDQDDESMQAFLVKAAERARKDNDKAAVHYETLKELATANSKRLKELKRAEDLAISISTKMIAARAKLPGNFEDYPLKAWVHGTGADATVVQEIATRLGPNAERVRTAIRGIRGGG